MYKTVCFVGVMCVCLCVYMCVCATVCKFFVCVFGACVLNQLLFWFGIKTTERKCEAKSQIIGPY